MIPEAPALITAAFTLGVQPTGWIAARGTWPLVAPMLAAGTVILTVALVGQTLITVLEANRIRNRHAFRLVFAGQEPHSSASGDDPGRAASRGGGTFGRIAARGRAAPSSPSGRDHGHR